MDYSSEKALPQQLPWGGSSMHLCNKILWDCSIRKWQHRVKMRYGKKMITSITAEHLNLRLRIWEKIDAVASQGTSPTTIIMMWKKTKKSGSETSGQRQQLRALLQPWHWDIAIMISEDETDLWASITCSDRSHERACQCIMHASEFGHFRYRQGGSHKGAYQSITC